MDLIFLWGISLAKESILLHTAAVTRVQRISKLLAVLFPTEDAITLVCRWVLGFRLV